MRTEYTVTTCLESLMAESLIHPRVLPTGPCLRALPEAPTSQVLVILEVKGPSLSAPG